MSKDFSNLLGGALANKKANDESIKDQIIIREDLKALIPALASEELTQLEENILKEGVRDPIIIWQSGSSYVLVDGHNRFAICKKYSIDFPFKSMVFKDEDEVRDWMIKNQLGRRNLTQEQQSYLRGLRYLQEKGQGRRTDLTYGQNVQKSESVSTAERLAREYNVSDKTIIRDAQFAEGLEVVGRDNPELKKEILSGTSKLSKSEVQKLSKGLRSTSESNEEETHKIYSAKELVEIAFRYVKKESDSFSIVCQKLNLDEHTLSAKEFFKAWDQQHI